VLQKSSILYKQKKQNRNSWRISLQCAEYRT